MRATVSRYIQRVILLPLALTIFLVGCEDVLVRAIQHADTSGGDADGDPKSGRRDTCLMYRMYLVEGDVFTSLGGGAQTISRTGYTLSGYSGRPEIEPRAQCRLEMDGYDGTASLFWRGEVVEELDIDRGFLANDQLQILAYDDPDGTHVELHVYMEPNCDEWPNDVSTRAEIEALER